METMEFPSIESLVNSPDTPYPTERKVIQDWRTLSPELQAMVPHVAELLVGAIGRPTTWRDMTEAARNIMSYSAVSVLAEARRRAAGERGASKAGFPHPRE